MSSRRPSPVNYPPQQTARFGFNIYRADGDVNLSLISTRAYRPSHAFVGNEEIGHLGHEVRMFDSSQSGTDNVAIDKSIGDSFLEGDKVIYRQLRVADTGKNSLCRGFGD